MKQQGRAQWLDHFGEIDDKDTSILGPRSHLKRNLLPLLMGGIWESTSCAMHLADALIVMYLSVEYKDRLQAKPRRHLNGEAEKLASI